jgi:hypothetical protein
MRTKHKNKQGNKMLVSFLTEDRDETVRTFLPPPLCQLPRCPWGATHGLGAVFWPEFFLYVHCTPRSFTKRAEISFTVSV